MMQLRKSDGNEGDWEPYPTGDGEVLWVARDDELGIGYWRLTESSEPIPYTPQADVCAVVLEGGLRLQIGDESFDVGPGESVTLPGGTSTVWHVETPYKQFFVFPGSGGDTDASGTSQRR